MIHKKVVKLKAEVTAKLGDEMDDNSSWPYPVFYPKYKGLHRLAR